MGGNLDGTSEANREAAPRRSRQGAEIPGDRAVTRADAAAATPDEFLHRVPGWHLRQDAGFPDRRLRPACSVATASLVVRVRFERLWLHGRGGHLVAP